MGERLLLLSATLEQDLLLRLLLFFINLLWDLLMDWRLDLLRVKRLRLLLADLN